MIIAVDTGGTKTLIASYSTDGTKTDIARFPTPRSIPDYLNSVIGSIQSHVNGDRVDAIAIALPGVIRGHTLEHAANLGWKNVNLVENFKKEFPDSVIVVGNDADIAGLAEMRALNPIPRTGLYVTLSTGIGTGLCFDGRLETATAIFEGGAMRLEFDGSIQQWESFASGSNFFERYGQYGSEVDDPDKWQDYAKRVSVGLCALIPIFEPDVVVIGGSMGTHFPKYQKALQNILDEQIPTYTRNTSLVQAQHPEEAVINGCYYYAVDQFTS